MDEVARHERDCTELRDTRAEVSRLAARVEKLEGIVERARQLLAAGAASLALDTLREAR
jgi:hypothetical protein